MRLVAGAVRATDIALAIATAVLAYAIYLWPGSNSSIGLYSLVVLCAALLQSYIFQFAGLYEENAVRRLPAQLGRLAGAWSLLFVLLITVAFLTKTSATFSRGWTLIWFTSGLAGLGMTRLALHMRMQKWVRDGRLVRNIAIIGAGEYGQRLIRSLAQGPPDLRIVGVFDDRAGRVPAAVENHFRLGTVDDLITFARGHNIDQIIVALPWSAEGRILEILQKLKVLPVDVRLSPDMVGFNLPQMTVDHLGSVPVISVLQKPLSDWKLLTKEVEDRVLAALILLFTLPLMTMIAVAIKLDSRGPVLFRQGRYGFNNRVIHVHKFRTMHIEAAEHSTVAQARRHDPRITRVGTFLRRTSLDELPQFLNVLNGEMSIVGPRPHAIPHNEYFARIVEEYAARHRVKPGITGWAQVNGWRGETDTADKIRKRIEHDLYYIENWSIGLDLKILLMTIFTVLKGENAY